MKLLIATGCNSYYLSSWNDLYASIKEHLPKAQIHFFDLGLNDDEVHQIKQKDIFYCKFDFSKYESWVNINNDAGQWAWKAQCIKEVMEQYPIDNDNQYLAWFDSRNIVCSNLESIFDFVSTNGIYSTTSSGTIMNWTFPNTIKYLDADEYIHKPMRNAALPVFNINMEWVRNFIYDYSKYSLIKECIYPEGSSRLNHRQDQSILSILFYKYKDLYHFADDDFYGGIKIHQTKNFTRPFVN
jgi:hypothetical protein